MYSSAEEMKKEMKNEATHYIFNEEIENTLKYTTIAKKNNLIKQIEECSLDTKRNFVSLIFDEVTDSKNEEYITIKLNDAIEDAILRNKLETLVKMNLSNKKEIRIRAEIRQGLKNGHLNVDEHKTIFFEGIALGKTTEEAFKYLANNKNQSVYMNFITKKPR